MLFERDPLSVLYDRQAKAVIGLAIGQAEKRKANRRLVPYVRVRVPNPLSESLVRDDGGLTRSERAFQRSLYHDARIHKPRRSSPGTWSLKCEWDPPPLLPGQARNLRVTVFSEASGARHSGATPRSQQWQHNPELRANWGTAAQRFPG